MSAIESQYRSALRWYPRSWRRANEDVVVGTLLDVAEGEGRDAPTRAELGDLRRSGLVARADAILPGAIRDRAASISLGAGTALAVALLTGQFWAAWAPLRQGSPNNWVAVAPELVAPDHVIWQLLVHPAFWVLAALVGLAGWTAASRALLILSIPASVTSVAFLTDESFLLRPALGTLAMMALLAVLGCTGRTKRTWLLAATTATGVLLASWLAFLGPFARTYFPRGGVVDFIASAWPSVALLGTAAVLLLLRRRLAAGAVLAASAPWLFLVAADVFWFNGFGGDVGYLVRPLFVALFSAWIPVAILLVVRRYARHPWLSPSESSDSPTSASRRSSTR